MNANTIRNKELVRKRIEDPEYWSFSALGNFYNIDKKWAHVIFERDVAKYATSKEIAKYKRDLSKIMTVGGYPQVAK